MKKEEFTFLSADGQTTIHAVRWIPEGEVRAVLQIAHGMCEYIERYERFALVLNEKGILVTGNDHLGHGQSITDSSRLGYFADKEGNRCVLKDLKQVGTITKKLYPDVPYFFLGHSMGSFLCRQVIAERGKEFAGAVVMGTGNQPGIVTGLGKLICKIIAAFKGWGYHSDFVNGMAFGGYNGKFGEKGGTDWLSSNKENVEKYNADPLCGFPFTLNGYYNMFHSIHLLAKKSYISDMPRELPVLFVSGDDDPVGDFGKAPVAVSEQFKKMGMKDVSCILYPGDRHEILSEKDHETVDADIAGWLLARMPQ